VAKKSAKEIDAISQFLGSKKYFFGDRISTYDAAFYGFIQSFFNGAWDHEVVQYARSKKNLRDYVDRMRKEIFPDLQP